MIKVNLLPVRAAAKMESVRKQISIAVLLLILMSIVVGFFHVSMTQRINGLNSEIQSTQKEIQKLKAVIAKVNQFKKDKAALEKKLGVINSLSQGRKSSVFMLDELSRVVPDELWFEKVVEKGGEIKLDGIVLNHDVMADFMTNMEKSPRFKSIRLKSTKQEKKGKLMLLKFHIVVRFEPPKKEEG